jgi:hypothetical protein
MGVKRIMKSRRIITEKDVQQLQRAAEKGEVDAVTEEIGLHSTTLSREVPSGDAGELEDWTTAIQKVVPIEIISAWAAIQAVIVGVDIPMLWDLALLAGVGVVTIIFMGVATWNPSDKLRKPILKDSKRLIQIGVSTLGFLVWAYTLGGPFARAGLFNGFAAFIAMTFFTLIIAIYGEWINKASLQIPKSNT